ncbi:cytochrome P450 [Rhodococcus sp. NPDC056960]|uniref:cytochrome P450 n=1 Tax=Rhodococcus sp. NPDC056960 TaxID=3345982 RepID=UPI00362FB494
MRHIFRTPMLDTDIAGIPVSEGQKIMFVLGAANQDPERWGENASAYDITRDAGGHVALGRGIHPCVGAPLARLETDVLLSTFARRGKARPAFAAEALQLRSPRSGPRPSFLRAVDDTVFELGRTGIREPVYRLTDPRVG